MLQLTQPTCKQLACQAQNGGAGKVCDIDSDHSYSPGSHRDPNLISAFRLDKTGALQESDKKYKLLYRRISGTFDNTGFVYILPIFRVNSFYNWILDIGPTRLDYFRSSAIHSGVFYSTGLGVPRIEILAKQRVTQCFPKPFASRRPGFVEGPKRLGEVPNPINDFPAPLNSSPKSLRNPGTVGVARTRSRWYPRS